MLIGVNRMIKRVVMIWVVVSILMMGTFGLVYSKEDIFELMKAGYKIYVNGNELKSNLPVLNYEGITYVPLRAFYESINAKVDWDSNSRAVKIYTLEETEVDTKTPTPSSTPSQTPYHSPNPTNFTVLYWSQLPYLAKEQQRPSSKEIKGYDFSAYETPGGIMLGPIESIKAFTYGDCDISVTGDEINIKILNSKYESDAFITLKVDSKAIHINNHVYKLDEPVRCVNGKTYFHVRSFLHIKNRIIHKKGYECLFTYTQLKPAESKLYIFEQIPDLP